MTSASRDARCQSALGADRFRNGAANVRRSRGVVESGPLSRLSTDEGSGAVFGSSWEEREVGLMMVRKSVRMATTTAATATADFAATDHK